MGVIASDNGGDYEPIPAGMHRAICINVFDVGYQPGYQGNPPAHKVVVLWEIEERSEASNKRFTVTRIYTLSIGDKSNLGNDLTSWRGRAFTELERKGFDLDKIIGIPCQLNLIPHNGDKVKIGGVLPADKRISYWVPETQKDYVPNFVKKMLAEQIPAPAKKPAGTQTQTVKAADDFTDDIPF